MTVQQARSLGPIGALRVRPRRPRGFSIAALALFALVVAGCASPGATWPGGTGSPATTGTAQPTTTGSLAPGSAGPSALGDIPAGRGIAEGGGGPLSYTFREEWRRARVEAWKWRSGAYLVMASGQYVNDDGVPSSWNIYFLAGSAADALLVVEIDPWGKVTATKEATGAEIASRLGDSRTRIVYSIIDSDTAVQLGKAALGNSYNLAKTKDPSLSLNSGAVGGGGPFWTYTLFYNSTATYVSARINALTSEVTLH